jgi:c(7)-type cytochrome triheme protein
VKKVIAAVMLTVFSAGLVFAADVITLPAKFGDVKFPHKAHQERLKNCKLCHEKTPGKIEGFGKEKAHKLCGDCHKAKGAGPMITAKDCKKCHTK